MERSYQVVLPRIKEQLLLNLPLSRMSLINRHIRIDNYHNEVVFVLLDNIGATYMHHNRSTAAARIIRFDFSNVFSELHFHDLVN